MSEHAGPEGGFVRKLGNIWSRALRGLGLCIALLVLCSALLYLFAYGHSRALRKVQRAAAYRNLQSVYRHFLAFGALTNPAPSVCDVFPFTNRIRIDEQDYECVIGMTWSVYAPTGMVIAATTEGKAIWFDRDKPPRFIEFGKGLDQ